jgi:hypothetical protein
MALLNLDAGRAPLADWNRWVDSLMATYKTELERNVPIVRETAWKSAWISHIVQKEAIQNSSDALDKNNSDKWRVIFEMSDTLPPEFITITDQGTCGLTGRTIVSKDELDNLEKTDLQKYQQERWARFEALSFPNIDPKGRGSKGQGKWTFIGASDSKTIVYDSLRRDDIYRIGSWQDGRELLQKPPEGFFAEEMIKKDFGLEPLEKVGTRIVIVKPRKELWEGFLPILESPLARYIGETWWELLKNGASIFIKWREHSARVETPPYYTDNYIEKNKEETWIIEDCELNWTKNPLAKVKELTIIRSKTMIPEGFNGIAIQRNEMKICGFDVQTENPTITSEIAASIYGWITFNEEGEKELRAIEHTTHYDFGNAVGTFGFHVFGKNGWLIREIRKFAEQRLGLGPIGKSKSSLSDILAINKLNKFANRNSLGGHGRPVGPLPPKPTTPKKEIRIKMPKPVFPHLETRRVEYEEIVKGITISIVNDSDTERKMKLTLVLKTASRKGIPERVLKEFVAKELCIASRQESEVFGPYEVLFAKHRFRDGTYVIEGEIVLLEGDVLDEKFGKSMVLDQERELVYLNEDPPTGGGLFEFIDRVEFKDEKTLQYRVIEKDDKYRIQINTLHPAYKHIEEIDSLLSDYKLKTGTNVPNPIMDYEIEIGAEAIAHYDLKKEVNLIRNEEKRNRFIEQRKRDEKSFFLDAMEQASRIAQEIRHEIL